MPLAQNLNAFMGAAVLGIIGAAGMYLVENYRQNKMRHQMAKDLARLDKELSQVKRELSDLLAQKAQESTRTRRSRNVRKANSIISTSTDDYLSASNLDSSDLEFYDVSDDEQDRGQQSVNQDNMLNEIDASLDRGCPEVIEDTLELLKDLCQKFPDDPDLLWRLGKAHHKVSNELDEQDDRITILSHINQGIEVCDKALQLKDDCVESHKWYAILIGRRCDFVGSKQKITDGHLFKKHLDKAIALDPTDASLHHMLGQFDFAVAGLKWYERKAASVIFAEPPSATYGEALEHFLEAEKRADYEWKMNRLMIAKCLIALDNTKDAVEWLKKADGCNSDVDKIDSEIKSLLEKYDNNR